MIKTKVTTNKVSIGKQHAEHSIKNFYYNISNDGIYILCQSGFLEVCLISIETGNRYNDPVSISGALNISDSEFHDICGGEPENFKLLSSVDIIASI